MEYMAPEYLKRDLNIEHVFDKEDVWAIGVISYELLTLKLPFNGNRNEVKHKIINN